MWNMTVVPKNYKYTYSQDFVLNFKSKPYAHKFLNISAILKWHVYKC